MGASRLVAFFGVLAGVCAFIGAGVSISTLVRRIVEQILEPERSQN